MRAKLTVATINNRLDQLSAGQYTSIVRLEQGQVYQNNVQKLTFGCERGHRWEASLSNMLLKTCRGCPVCNKKAKKTFDGFAAEMNERNVLYPDKKVYVKATSSYKNIHTKMSFTCDYGHTWRAVPRDVLNGSGCMVCTRCGSGYSAISIKWLERLSTQLGVNIQHAKNGGEYRIPGTRWYVDGFCEQTNTVYEFHGDAFHGNPLRYNSTDLCHPYNNTLTAAQLYQRTVNRINSIKSRGYNVVEMWESNFTP